MAFLLVEKCWGISVGAPCCGTLATPLLAIVSVECMFVTCTVHFMELIKKSVGKYWPGVI